MTSLHKPSGRTNRPVIVIPILSLCSKSHCVRVGTAFDLRHFLTVNNFVQCRVVTDYMRTDYDIGFQKLNTSNYVYYILKCNFVIIIRLVAFFNRFTNY